METSNKFSTYIKFKRFLENSDDGEFSTFKSMIKPELAKLWKRSINADSPNRESEERFRCNVENVIENYRGNMSTWSGALSNMFNSDDKVAPELYELILSFLC